MPRRFSERILQFVSNPDYEPMKARKLARALGIAEAEHGDFHDAVDALRRVGRVVLGTSNAVMLPHTPGQVVGTYRANPRGFGFVVPDEATEHGDLFIPPGDSKDALTGDKVRCRVIKRGHRGGKPAFGGRIVEVIERGESRFVGELRREKKLCYVEPHGNALHAPIIIGDAGAKSAKTGDLVVVEITHYPSEGSPAKGVIVERLGKSGTPGVDLLTILRQFHLPDKFPTEVTKETRSIVRAFDPEAEAESREDLSGLTIITIDPDDARDYDDAISLRRLKPGAAKPAARGRKTQSRGGRKGAGEATWELGVHIADVSAFVTPGSVIDVEARQRGTSVYLPGRVIPMLPEVLSNGLCSLQEGEPRLCKSAFIQYDDAGRVVGTRFANTVIRSAKRLTYRQATAICEGRRGRHGKNVVELVLLMEKLARVIQKRRLANGMIVLNLPSVDLILDDGGQVIDAQPEDTSYSHTIIEMFMVEANEAAARLLHSQDVPLLRRIHPPPDEESLEAIARFLAVGGRKLPPKITSHTLQKLLANLQDDPSGYATNLAVLKSMQRAEYSPQKVGHFALASDDYAHFTSPIRRYPDLMLHRLLDLHCTGRLKGGNKRGRAKLPGYINESALREHGVELSYLSRRAESAERELTTLKVLTLMEKHIGETFEGVVTGVTNFGLFVQHPKYLIDGLLRLEDLGDDWWEVDVKLGRVRGERSRQTYSLGTRIQVQIAEVDIPTRRLNLGLAEGGRNKKAAPPRRGGSRPATSKPRKTGKTGKKKKKSPTAARAASKPKRGPRKGVKNKKPSKRGGRKRR